MVGSKRQPVSYDDLRHISFFSSDTKRKRESESSDGDAGNDSDNPFEDERMNQWYVIFAFWYGDVTVHSGQVSNCQSPAVQEPNCAGEVYVVREQVGSECLFSSSYGKDTEDRAQH